MARARFATVAVVSSLLTLATFTTIAHAWWSPFSYDWAAVQTTADALAPVATELSGDAAAIEDAAATIAGQETDPGVVADALALVDATQLVQADTADILDLVDAINARIDGSEGTTLQLAADILLMAGEIGVMADRILWTELQIGVMADRIVESEYLIADTSLALATQASDLASQSIGLAEQMIGLVESLFDLL